MDVLDADFIKGFIRMADDGWRKGWHERNGGNLSYRIRTEEVEIIKENFSVGTWSPIGMSLPKLAGEYFLITGSGKFFRNVSINSKESFCIIELDEKGERYRICWGMRSGVRPTSELFSHLMSHEVKCNAIGKKHRVIYHAHPANIIALTYILPLIDEVFTRELWEMSTECAVVFPEGVGIVPWMVPGGKEIALATSNMMKKYNVAIWAHHGVFCAEETYDLTFGLMDTVEKAAEILVKVFSMRTFKQQTIQPVAFRQMAADFRLTLSEEFLYEKHNHN